MAGCDGIHESLALVVQNATSDITRAVENVATAFVSAGGYGSWRMHLQSNATIVESFRVAADRMIAQAKDHDDLHEIRELINSHLSNVVERTLAERTAYFETGNIEPHDRAVLCADLQHDMKRVKSAAITELLVAQARRAT